MDDYENEFNKRKEKLDVFKKELKTLLNKHNATINEHCGYPTAFHDEHGIG